MNLILQDGYALPLFLSSECSIITLSVPYLSSRPSTNKTSDAVGVGNALDPDVFATSVPHEVAEPHGRSSFAVIENIGAPAHDKEGAIYDVESAGNNTELGYDHEKYPPPSLEERHTLRKIADSIPRTSYVLCAVEFAERASYYGVQTVFTNFMENPLPPGGNGAGAPAPGTEDTAGALGMQLQFANAFVLLFTFLAYVIPIFGAWLADTKLGRYKTIAIGVLICGVAHIIMIFGALPSVLQAGNGLAPFLVSFFILAFGAGKSSSIQPN